MALLSRLFSHRQDELHSHSDINVLASESFNSELADSFNTMQQLAYHPTAPKPRRKLGARPRASYSRASQGDRPYQLNVRVSGEHRAAIRRYAKHERITLTDAIARAIALLTAPQ